MHGSAALDHEVGSRTVIDQQQTGAHRATCRNMPHPSIDLRSVDTPSVCSVLSAIAAEIVLSSKSSGAGARAILDGTKLTEAGDEARAPGNTQTTAENPLQFWNYPDQYWRRPGACPPESHKRGPPPCL